MVEQSVPRDDGAARPRLLLIAVTLLFFHQTLVAMSRLVVPVLAPLIASDLGINPALVGAYSGILAAGGTVIALGAGGLIDRHGAWRVCQIAMVVAFASFVIAIPGTVFLFAVAAFVVGLGPGITTPASSHVLAQVSPPKQAPFYFSIKQTGVPAGALLAGVLSPFLAIHLGWRWAFLVIGAMYVVLAVVLQPYRADFDGHRKPIRRSMLAGAGSTLKLVLSDRSLREMALVAFVFVGLQAAFDSFFVTFLVKGQGYALTAAGSVFAIAQSASIGARVLWGWVAGRFLSARTLLGGLGLVMAAASVVLGLTNADWSVPVLIIVAVIYAATAFSWNGVLLAEVARLAPPDQVGSATGGTIVFIMAAATIYPVVFAVILAATGSYGLGYVVAAAPALVAGLLLLR